MKLRVLLVTLALLLTGWVLTPSVTHAVDLPTGDTIDNGPGGSGGGDGGDDGVSGSPGVGGIPGVDVPSQTGSSVPRIMLTAFTTEPGTVPAGESFRVHFTVQNMSTTTRVSNIKITVSGGDSSGILPANGSSSTFIRSIRAEHSVSREMDFRTMASIEEGPHPLTLTIEYEDADFNQLQSTETVAIIVEQETRADTGAVQVLPDFVTVGQDASVSFPINNLGKTKLYNVRAALKEGQPITAGEAFVGTIEPGASGTADLLVFAETENFEPVVLLVTYENAAGVTTTIEKSFDLMVEPFVEPEEEYFPEEPMPEEGVGMMSPMTMAVIGGLVLLALIVIILAVRSRRKRAKAALDDDMALLGGEPLVPADPQ